MNWYCVHTKPQREKHAVEYLAQTLGLDVYFPRLRRTKVIRRVRRSVTEPLFPRYVFCKFDLSANYRAVRYAHDVLDLVSFGPQPAIVTDHLIESLKSWAGEEKLFVPEPAYSAGDRVRITTGPMQGLEAVVMDGRSEGERVAVLLSILGCEAQLNLDRGWLAKAG